MPELGHIVHDMVFDWVTMVPRRRSEKRLRTRRNLFRSGLFRRSRERGRKHKAPENKKQGKETKNTKNKFGAPQKEKGKCPAPKKEEKQRNPKRKKKEGVKRKEKKRSNTTQLQEKKKEKGMKKRKRIRGYLLNYVCHTLIYE